MHLVNPHFFLKFWDTRASILMGERQRNVCLEHRVIKKTLEVSAVFLEHRGGSIQGWAGMPNKASPKRLHLQRDLKEEV